MLSLSKLVTIAKRYAFDSSMSNESLINDLLYPYVMAGNIRMRGKKEFYLDKYRTSKIMQGQADVPRVLREARRLYGFEEDLSNKCDDIWINTLDPSRFTLFAQDILANININNPRENTLKHELEERLDNKNNFMAHLLIGVTALKNKSDREALLWRRGTGSLSWYAGTLFKFGFGQRKKRKNIVVIPVDCHFTLTVASCSEACDSSAVSEETIHGSWIRRMRQSGILESDLQVRVRRGLRRYTPNEDGSYPLGTIVPIENPKCTFLLLAVSKFNENGNAQSTPEDIQEAIKRLLEYYDRKGQGSDLYIPLIGTGLSRSGISHRESFMLLEQEITQGSNFVGGKVTIVVLPEIAEELGLIKEDL